jgi:hypothetical protein
MVIPTCSPPSLEANPSPEVGKVTLKSNCDEALSDESLKKSNGDEALNDDPL